MDLARSSYYYRSRKDTDLWLRRLLQELAALYPRYGYRRLHDRLRFDGWRINHKKVFRLYREEELGLRTRRRPSRACRLRQAPPAPEIPYEHWAADFMVDQLQDGTRFRVLNVIDLCSRKALATEASCRFPACRVTEVLDRLMIKYGNPRILTLDNGTEFTSRHFDAWACQHKIQLDFIRPGRPMENGYIESFNGKFRDECLSLHWFRDLAEARKIIENWRWEYNHTRAHSSLGRLPPAVYLAEMLGLDR
jgi:putative transposase